MRRLLQLVAAITLSAAATARAQITSPDILVAPTPRNPAHTTAKPADNLQWLWLYAQPAPGGNKADLLADPRFRALLQTNLKAPQAFWSTPGSPLADAASTFLAGDGIVSSKDNRHLIVTGCVVDHCAQRGLLYADLGEPNPLLLFAALRWNELGKTSDEENAPFTLWLFPSRQLDSQHLPPAFTSRVSLLLGGDHCHTAQLTSVIVVDPSGVPHILSQIESGILPPLCNPIPLSDHDSTARNTP